MTFSWSPTHPIHLTTAPSDWYFFPYVKRQLKGEHFQTIEDARAFIEGVIFDIPHSAWSGVIDSWFERMVKCVQAEGGFLKKKLE